MIYLETSRVTLHHAMAEEVYPTLEPGFTLCIMDGPYGISIASWDKMGIDGLADWYRPHLESVTRLMAPSSSLYVWNTAQGWARLDSVIRPLGWRYGSLVTWLKTNPPSQKGCETLRCWPDFTEVCGVYQRAPDAPTAIRRARLARGMTSPTHLDVALGYVRSKDSTRGTELTRRWEEGSSFPTDADWVRLIAWAPELQEYSIAAPFQMSSPVGNVWTMPLVGAPERIVNDRGEILHPTQKPLLFADRMIRASSRPGDRILSVFSGTCREAVACQRLPPNEARHCTSIEADIKYLDAVKGCFTLDATPKQPGQVGLFQ